VGAVMGAYNRLFGVPACASPLLLSNLLRGQWGFKGHVVSDCNAIYDFFMGHNYSPTLEAASASAVLAGCDLCCGMEYRALTDAVRDGLLKERDVDRAVGRILEARFRLGMFDPPAMVPYAKIPATEYDTPANDKLSLRMARETVVLLRTMAACCRWTGPRFTRLRPLELMRIMSERCWAITRASPRIR